MGDGKALQMATSHELGQNFAKAFDIKFLGDDSVEHYCWTTSWGASTRLIGGLIMAHGDDRGLIVPPRLAPIQAVVLCVRDEPEVATAADNLHAELKATGLRSHVDRRAGSFGRRITDWELKGVPFRVEVGPRDLAGGLVTVVNRVTGEKTQVPVSQVGTTLTNLIDDVQVSLYEHALQRRNANTFDVTTPEEALEAGKVGFAKIPWANLGPEGEAMLNTKTLSVRCLQRPDGTLPQQSDEVDLVAIVARSY